MPVAQGRVRPHPIVVVLPCSDHDLRLAQAVEDLPLQALVLELCSEISASLQASARLLPCAICTSICRKLATICSALQFFRLAIPGSFGSGQLSQSTRSKTSPSRQLAARWNSQPYRMPPSSIKLP